MTARVNVIMKINPADRDTIVLCPVHLPSHASILAVAAAVAFPGHREKAPSYPEAYLAGMRAGKQEGGLQEYQVLTPGK